jgi:hypothetical protein
MYVAKVVQRTVVQMPEMSYSIKCDSRYIRKPAISLIILDGLLAHDKLLTSEYDIVLHV